MTDAAIGATKEVVSVLADFAKSIVSPIIVAAWNEHETNVKQTYDTFNGKLTILKNMVENIQLVKRDANSLTKLGKFTFAQHTLWIPYRSMTDGHIRKHLKVLLHTYDIETKEAVFETMKHILTMDQFLSIHQKYSAITKQSHFILALIPDYARYRHECFVLAKEFSSSSDIKEIEEKIRETELDQDREVREIIEKWQTLQEEKTENTHW